MPVDFKTLKKDKNGNFDGNWEVVNDINLTRVRNFIKLQPEQLKFLPDGIPTFAWLSTKMKLPLGSFIIWLKQELLKRNYPIKAINYKVTLKGDLELNIVLTSGNYKFITPMKFKYNNI